MTEREAASDQRQLVSFRLGQEEYGIDILCVQEIIRVPRITPIPNTPPYVEGVLNLRGRVIPVISLRRRLGLPEAEEGKETRIIVADLSPNTVGFIVDCVSEVIRVPASQIAEAPETDPRGRSDVHLEGLARLEGRLLLILNLPKLLSGEESELVPR
jgi:purine-binding chemotaxis protein CheW